MTANPDHVTTLRTIARRWERRAKHYRRALRRAHDDITDAADDVDTLATDLHALAAGVPNGTPELDLRRLRRIRDRLDRIAGTLRDIDSLMTHNSGKHPAPPQP